MTGMPIMSTANIPIGKDSSARSIGLLPAGDAHSPSVCPEIFPASSSGGLILPHPATCVEHQHGQRGPPLSQCVPQVCRRSPLRYAFIKPPQVHSPGALKVLHFSPVTPAAYLKDRVTKNLTQECPRVSL